AVPRADRSVRLHHHDDRPVPDVRRAVRDDAGRAVAQHGEPDPAHVRAGLPLVAHGLRRRDRVRAARARHDRHADPAQAPAEGDAVTRSRPLSLAGLGVNAALAVLALLTVAPLVWM